MNHLPSTRSLTHKLALAAGGGAAALGGLSDADAGIVASPNTPIFPPASAGTNNWDVDGDGTTDFHVWNSFSAYAYFDDENGGRLVVPATAGNDGIAKLSLGVAIGTSLATAYKFHTSAQGFNIITSLGAIGSDASSGGWTFGDTGYFGFKFTNVSGTHYGWGEMTIADRGSAGDGDNYIVNEAYYNDVADAPVQVGVVPEPSSAALLALGAAGLAAWRRRRS